MHPWKLALNTKALTMQAYGRLGMWRNFTHAKGVGFGPDMIGMWIWKREMEQAAMIRGHSSFQETTLQI